MKIENEILLGGIGAFLIVATVGISIWLAIKVLLWVAS